MVISSFISGTAVKTLTNASSVEGAGSLMHGGTAH